MARRKQFGELAIDLHGMKSEDAVRAVGSTLDRAIFQGFSQVSILHGLGTGTLQRAVHGYLELGEYPVQKFYLDPFNPGRTIVLL